MRVRFNSNAIKFLENSNFLVDTIPFNITDYVLELGMGKGEMLSELAKKNSSKKYLGVEMNKTIAAKAAQKATEFKLTNFKILIANIENILEKTTGRSKELFLTFPDPWPKNKHEKRRLTSEKFLQIYRKLIASSGTLKFKTDNEQLFLYSINSFKSNNWTILNQTTDLHNSIFNKFNELTGYEKKFSSKGQPIYYFEACFQ